MTNNEDAYPDSEPLPEAPEASNVEDLLAAAFGEDTTPPFLNGGLDKQIRESPTRDQQGHCDSQYGDRRIFSAPYVSDIVKANYGNDFWSSRKFRADLYELKRAIDVRSDNYGALGILFKKEALKIDRKETDPKTRRMRAIALYQILADGVKYLGKERRERYRIHFENGKLMRRKSRHDKTLYPFSTNEVVKKVKDAGKWTIPSDERCLWIMLQEDNSNEVSFYSHVMKRGRFHHSSLNSGNGVATAGEWLTDDQGTLTLIFGNSGHYRPEKWRTIWALRELNKNGVLGDETNVFCRMLDGGAPVEGNVKATEVLNRFTEKVLEKVEFY
jgi:hypothetical protein